MHILKSLVRSAFVGAALTLSAGAATPAVAEDKVPAVRTIPSEFQSKIQFLNPQYLVYAPSGKTDAKLPLVIFLHGAGEVGNDIHQVKGKPTAIWEGVPKFNKGSAIRDGQWKLVRNSPTWELYDMAVVRTETHNLAAERPELVKQMDAAWLAWWKNCSVSDWAGKAPNDGGGNNDQKTNAPLT